MENPFAPKFDPCAPCQPATELVAICYNNDPRFFTVKVPYAKDLLVFNKKTALVVCNSNACGTDCNGNTAKSSAFIAGSYIYESQFNSPDAKWQNTQIEFVVGSAIVLRISYDNLDNLCDRLKAIVTDCSCDCD